MNNYYPYGSLIDAGSWSGRDYNFGFNGMLSKFINKLLLKRLNTKRSCNAKYNR